ncbi:hypothetical protein ACWEJ6_11445 [Nonomuraea sp. NPDC004702]
MRKRASEYTVSTSSSGPACGNPARYARAPCGRGASSSRAVRASCSVKPPHPLLELDVIAPQDALTAIDLHLDRLFADIAPGEQPVRSGVFG